MKFIQESANSGRRGEEGEGKRRDAQVNVVNKAKTTQWKCKQKPNSHPNLKQRDTCICCGTRAHYNMPIIVRYHVCSNIVMPDARSQCPHGRINRGVKKSFLLPTNKRFICPLSQVFQSKLVFILENLLCDNTWMAHPRAPHIDSRLDILLLVFPSLDRSCMVYMCSRTCHFLAFVICCIRSRGFLSIFDIRILNFSIYTTISYL